MAERDCLKTICDNVLQKTGFRILLKIIFCTSFFLGALFFTTLQSPVDFRIAVTGNLFFRGIFTAYFLSLCFTRIFRKIFQKKNPVFKVTAVSVCVLFALIGLFLLLPNPGTPTDAQGNVTVDGVFVLIFVVYFVWFSFGLAFRGKAEIISVSECLIVMLMNLFLFCDTLFLTAVNALPALCSTVVGIITFKSVFVAYLLSFSFLCAVSVSHMVLRIKKVVENQEDIMSCLKQTQ